MKTYQASSKYLYSEIDSEAVILDVNSGTYYGLNEVSKEIWQWMQNPVSQERLLEQMLGEYDVSAEEAHRDLDALLQEMLNAGLVEVIHEKVAPTA